MTTFGCRHTITQGRKGQTGSWCVACGQKVYEVHDRPCVECRHCKHLSDGSICKRHMMAIWSGMHVTYALDPGPGRPGLCFEAKETPCDSPPASA